MLHFSPASSVAVTALIIGAAVGCGPAEPPPGDVVARWIDRDPELVLEPSEIAVSRPGAELGPGSDGSSVRWHGHDIREWPSDRSGITFSQSGADPWLSTRVDFDADDVLAVEVELSNPGPGGVQLFWAGRWQRYSMSRMERGAAGRVVDAATRLYRFDVGANQEWRGRIRRLRVDVPPGAKGTSRLGTVRLYRRVVDAKRLEQAAKQPWKVDLGRRTRNALPAVGGRSWDRELRIPESATLSFGYGIQSTVDRRVIFRVIAIGGTGDESILFEDAIRPQGPRAGRWHDKTVDLADLAGTTVRLRLATEIDDGPEPLRGFPLWSNPVVVAPSAVPDRPNVIVVLLDTLRADHLSCYGHTLETSPRIDAWATGSAVRFANVVAPAPWTLPSHASIFTGLDAVRHGFNFWGTAAPELEMVAETLRRNGYTTAAVTGGGVLRPEFGFAQGFDSFDYWGEPESSREVSWVFDHARRWIDDHSQRQFFLFVHTYEVHSPHRRRQPFFNHLAASAGVDPPKFQLRLRSHEWDHLVAPGDYFVVKRPGEAGWTDDLDDDELATVGLMYDSAVATVDAMVGSLIDHLDETGLRGRTVIIVTSDHGEALGEDGRAGHAYLEDYNLMVPLVIELPGGRSAGAVVDRQVRLIDLMPTLLEAVGCDLPGPIDGRSLLPLLGDGQASFPDRAWAYAPASNRGLALRIENRLKYVFSDAAWAEVSGVERLIDLRTDPTEQQNLVATDSRLVGLRRVAGATMLAQHQGFRLEIHNGGSTALKGRLLGAWARHNRVKTGDSSRRIAHWAPGHPATFKIAPGVRTTLLLTALESPDVGLEASVDGVAARQEFNLSALRTPAALHLTSDGWRFDEAFDGEVATGVVVRRVGELPPMITGSEPTDQTLDQLRALGYVE